MEDHEMTKKHTKQQQLEPLVDAIHQSVTPPHIGNYLERIRMHALDHKSELNEQARATQEDIAHTIAELETWRSEIDATIAFLKAMRS
jgi:hypothetical protein